ncbi:MAG: ice-binding family protein [Kiritimatiellia bacterium]
MSWQAYSHSRRRICLRTSAVRRRYPGAGTEFLGNIVALTSDTLNTGATVNGRVFAINGAVTLDSNTINEVPEPSSVALFISGLTLFWVARRRGSRTPCILFGRVTPHSQESAYGVSLLQ